MLEFFSAYLRDEEESDELVPGESGHVENLLAVKTIMERHRGVVVVETEGNSFLEGEKEREIIIEGLQRNFLF